MKKIQKIIISLVLCFSFCIFSGNNIVFATEKNTNSLKKSINYTGEYTDKEKRHTLEVKQLSPKRVKVQFYMWSGTPENPKEEGTDIYTVKLKNKKGTFTINGTYHTQESFKCTLVFGNNTVKYKITGTSSRLNTGNKYIKLTRKYKKNFQIISGSW